MKLSLPQGVSFSYISPRSGSPIRCLSGAHTSCNECDRVEYQCARLSRYAWPLFPPRCETVPSGDRHALKSSLESRQYSGQYTTLWLWKPEFDSRIGHHVTGLCSGQHTRKPRMFGGTSLPFSDSCIVPAPSTMCSS